jgi:hypothetical protein
VKVDFTDADRERLALSYRRAALTAEETKQLEGWTDPALEAARSAK